jgi:hypothetical protein
VAQKPLIECTFLIPIRGDRGLSAGGPHSQTIWKWLHNKLFEFGGASRDLELKEGWYRDPDTGKQVIDLSRRYTVALSRRELRSLRKLLEEACAVFSQKCIYLSVAGQVEFVWGAKDESH